MVYVWCTVQVQRYVEVVDSVLVLWCMCGAQVQRYVEAVESVLVLWCMCGAGAALCRGSGVSAGAMVYGVMQVQRYVEAVESVLGPVRDLLLPLSVTERSWEELSVLFYSTFWSLAMYDLAVPSAAYERQLLLHRAQQGSIDDSKELVRTPALPTLSVDLSGACQGICLLWNVIVGGGERPFLR